MEKVKVIGQAKVVAQQEEAAPAPYNYMFTHDTEGGKGTGTYLLYFASDVEAKAHVEAYPRNTIKVENKDGTVIWQR